MKVLDELDQKEMAWQNFLKEGEQGERPPEFTLEDDSRRIALISEGWPDWNKKDFFNFIKMAE